MSYLRAKLRDAFSFHRPGVPAGGDDLDIANLASVRRHVFEEGGATLGVLIASSSFGRLADIELETALARALNDWQIEHWLEDESRLRGSIAIPFEEADLAVAEIARRADDARFIQVQIVGRSRSPLGHRKYWPIYEAAAIAGLPVAIHPVGDGDHPATGTGWPSFALEEAVVAASAMQANLISLVCEGALAQFPLLRVLCLETGFAWAPSFARRLDASWQLLREEIPDVVRPPSEYLSEQVWWTTQPMVEPSKAEHLARLLDEFDLGSRLVYASGFPAPDFDSPNAVVGANLPAGRHAEVARENAHRLYGGRV